VDRRHRLSKGPEFDTVYEKGTAIGGPLVVLRHTPSGMPVTRWGFAVGKRLSKRAVRRNRVKRRLKAAAETFPVRSGVDIVVTARNGAVEASFHDLQVALGRALGRAGLIKAEEPG